MPDDFLSKLGKFETVPVSSIDTDSDNHREVDNEHVKELANSIHERGLINPITLYHLPNKRRYHLIAGRHRYHAVKYVLKESSISARIYDYELSPAELRAIELYENVHRKDLTQVQKEQQIAHLHKLMQRIKGPSTTGTGATGHRIADTAKMVGSSVGSVANALKLDKAIQDFPELGLDKVESKADAMRILQRFATVITNQAIASSVPTTNLTDSYIVGDFFSNTLPPESFSIIECDPPYSINLAGVRKTTERDRIAIDYNEIPPDSYPAFMHRLCHECFRLASTNSWLIMWFGLEHYHLCSNALREAGFVVNFVPAIWKKGNMPGQANNPDRTLGNSYESFFWASKGSPRLRQPGRSNIFDYTIVPAQQKIHPTERPVFLITDILRTFAYPGMSVLCPFLGSGNTILAASELQMPCVGFELSEVYYNAFVARCAKEKSHANS